MRITIGITAFNEGNYLTEAWNSVLDQTEISWKAIMILDGKAEKKTEQIFDNISHPSLKKIKLTEKLRLKKAVEKIEPKTKKSDLIKKKTSIKKKPLTTRKIKKKPLTAKKK